LKELRSGENRESRGHPHVSYYGRIPRARTSMAEASDFSSDADDIGVRERALRFF
jgi:hypothetical protein